MTLAHYKMPTALHPGKIIALAHLANPATFGSRMSTDYPELVSSFLSLLRHREIPFVVVGGIALLQHVRGRNTDDIDLIISAPRLADIPELKIAERSDMFAYGSFSELRVDILFAEHKVFKMVAADFSVDMQYQIGVLPTANIDGLILLKLFALPSLYRQFDFDRIAIYEADIMQLLHQSTQSDEFYLDLLADHISDSDLGELKKTLHDTRIRLKRIQG